MSATLSYSDISWLQLSDLHIFASTDWSIMQNEFEELAKVEKPKFIVMTGDFRHLGKKTSFDSALKFLEKLRITFHLDKKDMFLVPGNHDVNDYSARKEIIESIKNKMKKGIAKGNASPDDYCEYMYKDKVSYDKQKDLRNGFIEYCEFVRKFYGSDVSDERVTNPDGVLCINWRNKINIVLLNSALVSSEDRENLEVIDIYALSQIFSKTHTRKQRKLPAIILSHHPFEELVEAQRERLKKILADNNTKAYLCGDEHILVKNEISPAGSSYCFPEIISGKSAVETGDTYSDVSVISYRCDAEGYANVQVYEYYNASRQGKRIGFNLSSAFYTGLNTRYKFPLFDIEAPKIKKAKGSASEKEIADNIDPKTIWLPDAETATREQASFNHVTKTPGVSDFLDPGTRYLGISSVKGIGKTFILQIKRRKLQSALWLCLPNDAAPSTENGWGTETVDLHDMKFYSRLSTKDSRNSMKNLWRYVLSCYTINCLKSDNIRKDIKKRQRLSDTTRRILTDEDGFYQTIGSILLDLLENNSWSNYVNNDAEQTAISRLLQKAIRERKETCENAQPIAIFIDKVDQALDDSAPPADCFFCSSSDIFLNCKIKKKKNCASNRQDAECTNCCRKKECDNFYSKIEGRKNDSIPNPTRILHLEIWANLQLGLKDAAEVLDSATNGALKVYYSIRQEALFMERDYYGEHFAKHRDRLLELSYTKEEQHTIFLDCIEHQEDSLLFAPELKKKKKKEEAFVGVGANGLCHPYCLNAKGKNMTETVFDCIYRHSFERSRDIQQYGADFNTKKILDALKEYSDPIKRAEFVKEQIEVFAVKIAENYYKEKKRYLPKYWQNEKNFTTLLSMLNKNLMLDNDTRQVCCEVNQVSCCPANGCKECKYHPFSMLYDLGCLGIISVSHSNMTEPIQEFKKSEHVGYYKDEDILNPNDHDVFVLHPAITKLVGKKWNRNIYHFNQFILGNGLPGNKAVLRQMFADRKNLTPEEFLKKYYNRPN